MSEGLRRLRLAVVVFLVMVPATALAQSEISWSGTEPLSGEVVDGELLLDVSDAGSYPLVVIDDPDVGPPRFSVDTTIRHEEVAGVAYLEMWTVLEDGSRYFTRTLADSGPLAYMTGSSVDRPASLPFELGQGGPAPASLEINLVTEGSGRFWIADLTLVPSEDASSEPTSTAPPTTTAATSPNHHLRGSGDHHARRSHSHRRSRDRWSRDSLVVGCRRLDGRWGVRALVAGRSPTAPGGAATDERDRLSGAVTEEPSPSAKRDVSRRPGEVFPPVRIIEVRCPLCFRCRWGAHDPQPRV